MKRKIFSKLLMGALLVASVSSFTSCKDYDDDINGLKEDIRKAALKSSLDELANTVNGVSTTASNALNLAQAAATKTALDDKAKELSNSIADVKAIADAAKKAAEGIDLTPYATKAELEEAAAGATKAVTDIQAKFADYMTATAVQEKIDDLKAEVDKCLTEEDIEEVTKKVDAAIDGVKAIWSAVTGVDLVGSFTATSANYGKTLDGTPYKFAFVDGTVLKGATSAFVFGKEEKAKNAETPAVEKTYSATPTATYTPNDKIRYEEGVIIRVNPANAAITKDNVKLMNSKGESLAGIVDVKSVEPYVSELITRAGSASGLWKVTLELTDAKKFYGAVSTDNGTFAADKTVLFAVAINNTADQSAERDVISSYDVAFSALVAYEPAKSLGNVRIKTAQTKDGKKGAKLSTIYNRYAKTSGQDGKFDASKGSLSTPTGAFSWDKDGNGTADDRSTVSTTMQYVYANLNEDIAISFADVIGTTSKKAQVEKFYVVLDDIMAIESTPSEINAWNSYTYEGLNTMFDAAEGGKIKVSQMSVAQDYIGFRIFAVNYDGTLVDPDGAAFYVYVANPKSTATVSGSFVANYKNRATGITDVTSKYNEVILPVTGTIETDAVFGAINPTITSSATIGSPNYLYSADKGYYGFFNYTKAGDVDGNQIVYQFLSANDVTKPATKWSEMKYLRLIAKGDMTKWVDSKSAAFTFNFTDKNGNAIVSQLNVTLTKALPTEFPGLTALDPYTTGDITLYPAPAEMLNTANDATRKALWSTPTTTSAFAYKSLKDVYKELASDDNYIFTYAGAANEISSARTNNIVTKAGTAKGTAKEEVNYPTPLTGDDYQVVIAVSDFGTAFPTKVQYIYEDVSSENTGNDVILTSATTFNTTFADALYKDTQSFAWTTNKVKDAEGNITETAMNQITIGTTPYSIAARYLIGKNETNWMSSFSSKVEDNLTTYPSGYSNTWSVIAAYYDIKTEFSSSLFTVKYNPTSKAFEFTRTLTGDEPTTPIEATMTIKAKDKFKKESTWTLPVTINPQH